MEGVVLVVLENGALTPGTLLLNHLIDRHKGRAVSLLHRKVLGRISLEI